MTHDELVRHAFAWLKNKKYCSVVSSELVAGFEQPDAIGWHAWESILIEAKASIGDFRADQQKSFRQHPEQGMGVRRYYIVPEELVEKIESQLPDRWGLLFCRGRGVKVVRESGYFENDKNREIDFLLSVIRRIAAKPEPLKGINVRCYTYMTETEPRAALFVEPEAV